MKRVFSLIFCAFFAFSLSVPSRAASHSAEIDSIMEYNFESTGAADEAAWAKKLAQSAGMGAEWYALSLRAMGTEADMRAYAQALADYLSANKQNSTGAQRCALAFIASGIKSEYIAYAAENTIGKQGIMSYIWGLHLLNNGAACSAYTAEELAAALTQMRLADGGFALSGDTSNVDVTAMALCALAPHRALDSVNAAVESALSFLSAAQRESGGFVNYGIENCESAAQVVLALCSLGIDPEADARFTKNGNSAVDALRTFALADGGFAHAHGGEAHEFATQQALQAFIAMERLEKGKSPFFVFEGGALSLPQGFRDVGAEEAPTAKDAPSIKDTVCIAVIALCALGIVLTLIIPGKKREEE